MTPLSRIGLAGVLVLLACEGEAPTRPSSGGGMAVRILLPPGQSRSLESGRYQLEGPTPKSASVNPGDPVTISDLAPGAYALALEGFIGGELDQYGKTSDIQVVEGANTPVTVALASFVPTMSSFPASITTKTFPVSFSSIADAVSYQVETATDSAFTINRDSVTTTQTSMDVTVPVDGSYYVRVRAMDAYQARGRATAPDSLRVVTCTNCWVNRASLPTAREYPAVGVVKGVLYAVGGDLSSTSLGTVDAYDPKTNSWTPKASMPTPRSALGVGVVNGVLYAVGGFDFGTASYRATVEAYDPVTNIWTSRAPMPTARTPAVGVVNGVLYAVGGDNLGTVAAYDPVTNSWTAKASMPTQGSFLGVGVVNGVLYAVGGYDGTNAVATVLAYDPVANRWTARASLPAPRRDLGVGVVNGVLYAVGGYDGSSVVSSVFAYDPVANSWTPKTSMPTLRNALGVGVVNGLLYALGGVQVGELATVEAYER